MTIREALRRGTALLEEAGVPDADYDAAQLMARLLNEDALMMRIESAREFTRQEAYEHLLQRRAAREPLQYILGDQEFMGLTFHVEEGVLIPRADTEILCEEALRRIRPGMRVLDIGTGSGALAVSIKHHCPGADVTAVDVSDTALAVASANAERLGAAVRFLKSDCFAALQGETFDVIVSNPPYIPQNEMEELMPEVLKEPHLALYGGEDGLDFYRKITKEAPAHLNAGGSLLFEIGWLEKDGVSELVKACIGEPFALQDYGGNWRVVGAKKR